MGDAVLHQDRGSVKTDLTALLKFHLSTANVSLSEMAAKSFQEQVSSVVAKLELFLDAAMTLGEVTPRTLDIIVSFGEYLSASFVASFLADRDIRTKAVDLKDVLCDINVIGHEATHLGQDFYDLAAVQLADYIQKTAVLGVVPVVTGFFGPVPGSLLQQIGRGYTDLTAALLARGLSADRLTIWKEVSGVYSADPSKVQSATLIPSITPDEAAELTYYGAEVIHPFTMRQATHHGIAIQIKDVRDPCQSGTIVQPEEKGKDSAIEIDKPRAVTIKEGIVVLSVSSKLNQSPPSFFSETFQILARHSVLIDLISTSRVDLSMAIAIDPNSEVLAMIMKDLSRIAYVSLKSDLAIVSLIGRGMRHRVGMSARMFTLIASAGVNIEMISQGASEINISCVISTHSASAALSAIHSGLINK
jgi:aspartate kinase